VWWFFPDREQLVAAGVRARVRQPGLSGSEPGFFLVERRTDFHDREDFYPKKQGKVFVIMGIFVLAGAATLRVGLRGAEEEQEAVP
jgi:hypothetical protein